MKNLFLTILTLLSTSGLIAQTNADVVGKTVTDSIQITAGAVTGHVLQSVDGVGLGKWVAPSTIGDNLGNHTATTSLNMSSNTIDSIGSLSFPNGSAIAPAAPFVLSVKSDFDMNCFDIKNVDTLSFCVGGGPSPVTLSVVPGGMAPVAFEMILGPVGAAPMPAPVAFGIGGPANPPFPGPIPPIGPPSVLALGGAAPGGAVFNLGVHGEGWAYDWWATSDARFKKDIESFDGALSKITRMKPVNYHMNTEKFPERNFPKGKKYGFLAQDLLEVAPEVVTINTEGYLLVQYDGLIPILTEGIKELDTKVQKENLQLKKEISAVQKENEILQSRLEKIEDLIKSSGKIKKRRVKKM